MPFFSPKLNKSFSIRSIDNMLSLKNDDKDKGEKLEKNALDPDFKYDDEILDAKIGKNFYMLFMELSDQIKKWDKINLKQFNGILEIKFGNEIYSNRDYYSFLAHLAGKNSYDIKKMLEKQDTMLEEMVATHMTEEDVTRFGTDRHGGKKS